MDMMQHHQATVTERLQQLFISPTEIERAVQQHIAGGSAAHELMRLGQEVVFFSSQRTMCLNQFLIQQRLVRLREDTPAPSTTILSDGRQIDQSPHSSRPPSPITTVQNQIEQALLDLHRLTHIPPTIPILNNQVKKTDPTPVRGGPYSQIFEGRWLGEKKVCLYAYIFISVKYLIICFQVALKTLRIMDGHDLKAERLQLVSVLSNMFCLIHVRSTHLL